MSRVREAGGVRRIIKQVFVGVVFLVVIVFLMLWLIGSFRPKVGAMESESVAERPVGDARLVPVRSLRVPATESAVGTIRAVHESSVASKILAKVVEVRIKAGQKVAQDEVLVRLDDADLKARRQQAEAAAAAARANRDQAKTEFNRIDGLFKQNAAAKIEFERATTGLKDAEAKLEQAHQALREAETNLGYATIVSPLTGVVVDKKVESGDTVTPGQVLATLYDPTRMQLVASVRESLTHRLKVGQVIGVQIESLGKTCEGQVSEIVPEAQSASRSFQVKVTGPCPPGMYTGMFGRLLIPLDEEDVLVVPGAAVRRVGQLDMVDVADEEGKTLRRRSVQLGRTFGEDIQVLSGLKVGEKVALTPVGESGRKGV